MCTRPNYIRYNEVHGTRSLAKNAKRIQFVPHVNFDDMLECSIKEGFEFIPIPCGKCFECKTSHAQQWADRCTLESSKYRDNWFVTLTYDDKHLPKNQSLVREDIQNFIKRVRMLTPNKLKVFYSGEYGDSSLRPHYHLIIFNLPLDDLSYEFKEAYSHQYAADGSLFDVKLRNHLRPLSDNDLMYSESIHRCWKFQGNISISHFTYATACYVAQYVTKKAGGHDDKFYKDKDLLPEFIGMSKGLGSCGYSKRLFISDIVYQGSFNAYGEACTKTSVALQKKKLILPADGQARVVNKMPRYFERIFERDFPSLYLKYKMARKKENLASTERLLATGFRQRDLDIREYTNQKKFILSRTSI